MLLATPSPFSKQNNCSSFWKAQNQKLTLAKNAIMKLLIDLVVPEELKETALAHLKQEKEEDFDSDLSEVISELGQDDGNAQDLKSYKEKKRNYKIKKKLAEKEEVPTGKRGRKPKQKQKPKPKPKQRKALAAN